MLSFSALAYTVDRAATLLHPRVRRTMERLTGDATVSLGVGIAADGR